MTSFDFAPLLPADLPPAAARWTGLPKYNFTGGNNDGDAIPLDGLIAAANAVMTREGRSLATYGLANGPQGYRRLRDFLVGKLKRDAGISCSADDILMTSGSLQALDLVNSTLLSRGDTVLYEQESYEGSINRMKRMGVEMIGIPLDRDGMRTDAVAAALADLKGRGIRPKYIYTIPTVQNPTGTIMPESRRVELLRLSSEYGVPIFEDDCYADLIWDHKRPPAIYAMSKHGGVIHIGSFSKSVAPALRVGYIVAPWEFMSRTLALKTDAGSGALEQMVLAEFCTPHFNEHVPELTRALRAKLDTLMEVAQRAVRHRGRIRGAEGRDLPLGKAAGSRRHHEALSDRARCRCCHQSRPAMVDRRELLEVPDAALLCEPLARGNSQGCRAAG